jgi:hypothetical protein
MKIDFTDKKTVLLMIVLLGLAARLLLAFFYYGTGDVTVWEHYSTYWERGLSPYDEVGKYNYFPLWFWGFSFVTFINKALNLPYSFIVKIPFILTDLATLIIIVKACGRMKIGAKGTLLAAGAFFLNPVSILISGYHGQFCNMSVMFAMLAWYFAVFKRGSWFLMSAVMMSVSVAVKHFTVILVPVIAFIQDKIHKKILVFLIAPLCALIAITPYFIRDPQLVINSILKYNLGAGYWGWSGVIVRSVLFITGVDLAQQGWFEYLSYFNYFLYAGIMIGSFFMVKYYKAIDSLAIVFLLFYVFTTQIAPQYSVWIIPFAVFRRGKYFYAYTITATVQLVAFYYCHHRWFWNEPFVGFFAGHVSKVFIIFRHLTWLVCVLWLADYFGVMKKIGRKHDRPGIL